MTHGGGGTDHRVPLDRRVLVLWRVRSGAAIVAAVFGAGVPLAVSGRGAIGAAVALGGLTVLGPVAWWWTGLAWGCWRFEVGAQALHLDHGVLTRHASTIPFHRVQHIDLEAGPLERRLGLATLVLRTASASSDSTVPGIDAAEAERLRRRILELVGTGDAT